MYGEHLSRDWVQGAHQGCCYGGAEGECGHSEVEKHPLLGLKAVEAPGGQVGPCIARLSWLAPRWPGQTGSDPGSGSGVGHKKGFGKESRVRRFGVRFWVM